MELKLDVVRRGSSSTKPLIEPYGIEMIHHKKHIVVLIYPLIEPYGIEIQQKPYLWLKQGFL